MRTLELENYGVMEMSSQEMMVIDGEYSWNQFCRDAGYTAGYMVGLATNAAKIAGDFLLDLAAGKAFDKILK